MADWISLRDFARRRGCTLAAVQKAIATGRVSAGAVTRDARGRLSGIDADQAAIDWHDNTDPELALRTGTVVPAPSQATDTQARDAQTGIVDEAPGGLALSGAESPLPRAHTVLDRGGDTSPDRGTADADTDSFRSDRARNERIKAVNAELDLALRLKVLVHADDVRRTAFDAARAAQDALMRLPDRLAPLLAAETDVARIRALLDQGIREALHGLAERAEQLAAA